MEIFIWRTVGIWRLEEGEDVLSPDSSLTKIWKLSEDGDEDVDVEEALDDEREVRMLGDAVEGYEWMDGRID